MKDFRDNNEHLNCHGKLLVQLMKQRCYLNIACYAHTCPGLHNLDQLQTPRPQLSHPSDPLIPLIGGSISKLKSNWNFVLTLAKE